jgi:hypothetical protein
MNQALINELRNRGIHVNTNQFYRLRADQYYKGYGASTVNINQQLGMIASRIVMDARNKGINTIYHLLVNSSATQIRVAFVI